MRLRPSSFGSMMSTTAASYWTERAIVSPNSPSVQWSTAKPFCFNPFTMNEAIFLSSSTTSTRITRRKLEEPLKNKSPPDMREGFVFNILASLIFVHDHVAAAAFAPDAQQRALVLHVLGQLH